MITADDRFAIEQLLSSYGVHHDNRDFEALARCFVDDATYTMVVAGTDVRIEQAGASRIVGQIREFKSRQHDQRRHVITNFLFQDQDVDRARVRSYVTVIAVDGASLEVVTSGTYDDSVVRTDRGWLISEKTLHLDKGF